MHSKETKSKLTIDVNIKDPEMLEQLMHKFYLTSKHSEKLIILSLTIQVELKKKRKNLKSIT